MPSSRRQRQPTIALIGRTNVGKSTLFNRFIEQDRALIAATPGTTRDRSFGTVTWRGLEFEVVDTGGVDIGKEDILEKDVIKQAQMAVQDDQAAYIEQDESHQHSQEDQQRAGDGFAAITSPLGGGVAA